MIRFKRKYFNPLYFILNDLLKINTIRTILVYGGKSSSKTASIAQVLSKECLVKAANSIAFRKESTIIKTTIKKSFDLALKTMFIGPAFEKLEFSYRCNSGAEIVLKGLDSEEKAKGIESYKYLYLDELNHFTKDEFQQFNLSLRGIEGQKIFASWNPVSENSWVKKELIDNYEFIETEYKLPCSTSFVKISTCGKIILIKTTWEDNFWIAGAPLVKVFNKDGTEIVDVRDPLYKEANYGYRDENLIAEYQKLAQTDFNAYRVNVLGEWGIRKTGGEFWKQFSEIKHVRPIEYDPETTLHFSLDENVNPYVTQTIWQIMPGKKQIRQVHEILSRTPDNNAPKAARQAIKWLTQIGYKNVIYVYGDPSAGKRSTIDPNNASFYDKYIEQLQVSGFRVEKRVARSAPEVALSAAFINDIYENNLYGWSISISDKCYTSIEDYVIVKEDQDGKMLKEKVKDKDSGVTYEPYGHCSDSKRYFITTILKEDFAKYKVRGKPQNVSGFFNV